VIAKYGERQHRIGSTNKMRFRIGFIGKYSPFKKHVQGRDENISAQCSRRVISAN
jgi:hypothetical protein